MILIKTVYIIKWPEKGIFKADLKVDPNSEIAIYEYVNRGHVYSVKLVNKRDYTESLEWAKKYVDQAIRNRLANAKKRVEFLEKYYSEMNLDPIDFELKIIKRGFGDSNRSVPMVPER